MSGTKTEQGAGKEDKSTKIMTKVAWALAALAVIYYGIYGLALLDTWTKRPKAAHQVDYTPVVSEEQKRHEELMQRLEGIEDAIQRQTMINYIQGN